ncbi:MAG: RNA polymerase sigma-70 factor [Mangrovibacterium sp.]
MKDPDRNNKLILSLKNGDESAFRSVFLLYFEPLVLFARAYVADEETAKDMVQDVFSRFWQRRLSLQKQTRLKAYLYQATRNHCLNYLKRIKVEARYEKQVRDHHRDLLLNLEALSHLEFGTVTVNELQASLEQAVCRLPGKCREVFELSRYDGMKNEEIARELNISLKTVEGHITRALKQLKDQLKPFLPGPVSLLLILRHKRETLIQYRGQVFPNPELHSMTTPIRGQSKDKTTAK